MSGARVVVIVGKSADLDRAVDALAELDVAIRVIPTLAEAERALAGARPPDVAAVMVCLEEAPSRGLHLIRSLRERAALANIPIAVWTSVSSAHLLAEAYAAGASSGVLTVGSHQDADRLAQMIHYWAVANEPPVHEVCV